MAKFHGFTCPSCGSHMFGTHKNLGSVTNQYPAGAAIGSCQGFQDTPSECRFTWNRADSAIESQCLYSQTREEWMADYDSRISEPLALPC